jgi:DNA-binding NtrC family response regulator
MGPIFSSAPVGASPRETPRGNGFGLQPDAEGIQRSPQRKSATLLVVDDDEMLRKSTIRVLREERFQFREACDGVEGLDVFSRGGIDLVITDFRMPRMGGFELLQKIRSADGNARVVLASGNFSPAEKDAAYAHGAFAVLDKPYDLDLLRTTIDAALAIHTPGAIAKKHGTILIVDDDGDHTSAIMLSLERHGYRVMRAENGLDGIGVYANGGIDLIISDLHMPVMDGLEFIRMVKMSRPEQKFIMMSGGADRGEIQAIMEAGALALYRKPLEMSRLIDAIEKALA